MVKCFLKKGEVLGGKLTQFMSNKAKRHGFVQKNVISPLNPKSRVTRSIRNIDIKNLIIMYV